MNPDLFRIIFFSSTAILRKPFLWHKVKKYKQPSQICEFFYKRIFYLKHIKYDNKKSRNLFKTTALLFLFC